MPSTGQFMQEFEIVSSKAWFKMLVCRKYITLKINQKDEAYNINQLEIPIIVNHDK